MNVLEKLNDKQSYQTSLAERAFNQELKGGCHVAIAAFATLKNDEITLKARVASSDGQIILERQEQGNDPVNVGVKLAQEMISLGAREILEQ